MKNRFVKIFSGVVFLVFLSKALGFVRESMIAARYGAGFTSDIYVFEDGLINAIYTVFAGVIATTYIPKATSLDEKERNTFTSDYLVFLLSIILLITFIFLRFTPTLLKILVPGFFETYNENVLHKIILITRINMISLILVFLENYLIVLLQSHNYFVFSSIQGIILNVTLIVYLLFFYKFDVEGIIISKIISHVINVGILIFFTIKKSLLKLFLQSNMYSEHLKEVIKLALPVLFVNLVSQLNYIVDRSMASNLDSGSMALLSYSNTIATMLYSVIGVTVCQIAYTDISEHQEDPIKMNQIFVKYLKRLISVIFPCGIVLAIYSREVSSVLFERGRLDSANISVMSIILIYYIPSNVALCMRDMHNRLLYIYKKTTIPSIINLLGLVMNIVLNIVLTPQYGVYGLALATSISSIFTLAATLFVCRKIETVNKKDILFVVVKSVVCIVVAKVIHSFMCFEGVVGKILFVSVTLLICMFCFNFTPYILGAIKGGRK